MFRNGSTYLFLLLLLWPAIGSSQRTCTDRLNYAKELFDMGQIEQIPAILDSCSKDGFSKNQEIQAYSLLIQTYLFDNNRRKAKEVMFRLLKKNPEISFTKNDPIEIKEIFDLFMVRPDWSWGISAGTIISQVHSIQNYSVFNLNNLQSTYTPKTGFYAGIKGEKWVNSILSVSLGLNFKKISYQNKEISADQSANVVFKENTSFLSMPLSFNIYWGQKKVAPFIYIGGESDMLIHSGGNYNFQLLQEGNNPISINGQNNITNTRNPITISAMSGVGLRFKIPKGLIKFWVGYHYNLTNYINSAKRYQNLENIMVFRHIDDNILLNQLSIGLSFSNVVYKVKLK